jgi:hypothetical protein
MSRMLVDLESALVDNHVMVKPTEEDEVGLVGSATFGPGEDVVRLEPMSAGAAIGGADSLILVEQGSP